MKKHAWRLYSDYLKVDSRESAEEILRRAAEHGEAHLLRLAAHFGRDWGRLPDELHNMVVLIGGPSAAKYLDGLGK